MKDPLWQGVYTALRPLLDDTDIAMAPRGDWPAFPCAAILYDDLTGLKNCAILVLHKGQLTSIPKTELQHVARNGSGYLRSKCSSCSAVLERSKRRPP